MTTETIATRWLDDDAARQPQLDRVRICSRLTDPSMVLPRNFVSTQKLPQNFQSIGARGMMGMAGKILVSMYTPDLPWFSVEMTPEILFSPDLSDDEKQRLQQALFVYEVVAQTTLESGVPGPGRRRRRTNFRTAKRDAIERILCTGESLERITDDYRIIVFKIEQYVTRRDSCGDVLYHVIRENVDLLTLTDKVLIKAGIKPEDVKAKPIKDRMEDIFTDVEWQPRTKKWLIRQEIKDKIVNESEEPVSAFVSTPYKLSSGDHYGRGFVETNLFGDLRSLDELCERKLDFAAVAAKFLTFIDAASELRPEDFSAKTGTVKFGARIANGVLQDAAIFQSGKMADFSIVQQTTDNLRAELGGAMLMGSEVTPQKERTTAYQVEEIRRELDGAMGGVYAPIADDNQEPTIDRTFWQLTRDKKIRPLPAGSAQVRTLTGVAALAKASKAQDLRAFIQDAATLGPEAIDRIDKSVALDVLARYRRIDEPGLILTKEQMAERLKAQLTTSLGQEAASRGIDAAGTIAETAAAKGPMNA